MTMDMDHGDQTRTDGDLVRGALADDSDAWEELVCRYDASLRRVARFFRLDHAATEDAVQTTWLRLVEHLDTLREPDKVGSWLMTTLRRQVMAMRRGQGLRLVRLDGTDVAAPDRSPEELVLTHDRDVKTMAALLRLPDRSRTLLTLLLDAGLSYGQVSAQLRMPVGSIGPTRARSLEMLRHELAAVGIDGDALIA